MLSLLWTFPVIMIAAIVIGWAAELTAVHLSAGMALAVLAWLQTSPEFAVEATIAWSRNTHLALANLTGSLRLLMGLGWPMIFLIYWFTQKRRTGRGPRDVVLPISFSVEAAGLAVPVLYFLIILAKGTWTALDGVILCGFYAFYFWMLNRERKFGLKREEAEEEEDEPWVVQKISKFSNRAQYAWIVAMFVFGGLALFFTVHPFVESLKTAAFALGVSEFVFIQWVAPIASEFPEKITAFNWARTARKVPMGIVNMLSSITSQWTLLAGLVPLVFSVSAGYPFTIEFDDFQRTELLLTIAQSALAVAFLSDLKIRFYEAMGLFALWFIQFLIPNTREPLVWVYGLWFAVEMGRLAVKPSRMVAWATVYALLFPKRARR